MTETNFNDLVDVMWKLRKECPWDKEQTHDSIKAATLEEAYEVVEAIDDALIEGTPHTSSISHIVTSADPSYAGLTGRVSVSITDNDKASSWLYLPLILR